MMQRALEQRWPIEPSHKKGIVARLLRIIASDASTPREVTAAAKALLAAESQNQADEHKAVDVELDARNIELDAIAADLGIETSVVVNAERTRIGCDNGVAQADSDEAHTR